MSPTRIYTVAQETGDKFLIEAATPAQALRHVTAGMFRVEVASAKDVAQLMAQGVKVESAKAAEATEAATRG